MSSRIMAPCGLVVFFRILLGSSVSFRRLNLIPFPGEFDFSSDYLPVSSELL